MADRILGRLQTPVDANTGLRTDIHLITSTDAIATPSGITLTELLARQGMVISNGKPSFACTWFKPDSTVSGVTISSIQASVDEITDDADFIWPNAAPGEKYPTADGSTEVGNDGTYDYYGFVNSSAENALQVVSDDVTGADYDPVTMIHISLVVADLPSVSVGDYVKYYYVIADEDMFRINGGDAIFQSQ